MKLLCIHANYFNYQVREKAKAAEEITPDQKAGGMRDPLVVFASAEKTDEKPSEACDVRPGSVIEQTLSEIRSIASKVKTKNIVLFPFAHLSAELAAPDVAIQILKCVACKLEEENYRVLRVPFGWYKAFEFKSKGHPLAVLSRSFPRKAD
ncbi:MAG: threonyl-tRNA synthetase editing domain-containing protein [Candidatus Hadarchaeota archaeon]